MNRTHYLREGDTLPPVRVEIVSPAVLDLDNATVTLHTQPWRTRDAAWAECPATVEDESDPPIITRQFGPADLPAGLYRLVARIELGLGEVATVPNHGAHVLHVAPPVTTDEGES